MNQPERAAGAPADCQWQGPTAWPRPPDLAYRCRNDDQRTLEFVGAGVERLTGFPAAEFTAGRVHWAQLVLTAGFERAAEMARQAAAGQPYRFEYHIRRRDGTQRRLLEQGQGVFDPAQSLIAFEGFITDLTGCRPADADGPADAPGPANAAAAAADDPTEHERLTRRQVEEALRSRERELQTLTDHSPDIIGRVDPHLRHLFISRAISQVTGKSAAEYLGKTNEELGYPPDLCAAWSATFNAVLRTGEAGDLEFEFPSPAGLMHFSLRAVPEFGPDGRVAAVVFVTRDVTRLKQAEERARLALAAGNMATWDLRLPAGPTVWNDAHYRMLGYRPGEVTPGYPAWAARVHPDDLQAIMTGFRRSLAEGADYVGEFRVRWPDGTLRWLESRGRTERDAAGRPARSYGVVLDLTTRKVAEEALRRSNERLRLLLDALPVAVSIAEDPQCRVITGNPAAAAMFETTRDTNVSASAPAPPGHRYFHQGRELSPAELPMQLAVLGNRCVTDMQLDARLPSGREWTALITARPLHGPDGEVIGGLSILHDITERQQTAEALRLSEEKLRLAQRVAEIGTFDWDIQSGVNTWTPELEAMHGLPPGGFAGTQAAWEDLIHPADRAATAALVEHSFATREPTAGDWRVCWPDGSVHWLSGRWRTFTDAAGQPVRMIGVNFDITARKQVEEDLREADRRKEAFIAILAHELRNPLAPISNAVEILKLTGSLDPTQQAARDMIDRQVRHLVRLVDDLLDVSRINQGRLQLRREQVALATLLEQVLEAARPQIEQAGHLLTATLPPTPILLDADPVRLAQVFHNLLDNACKYSERGGAIRVSAERVGAQVVVCVADRGIGIAPADLPHLFELFVQAGTPAGQLPAGLGIGLALCRGLTELHGGTIAAHSAGPGQGSEVRVTLPVLPDASALPADPPAAQLSGPTAPVSVLVVDDNRDSAEALAFLLRATGYAVTTAHDGLEGVAAAARERPQIVLLDLGMPGLDGYGACRRIREQPWGRAIRIIALTGWGRADDRRRIAEAGFDLHLVKPIELTVLLEVLGDTPAGKAPSST